MSMSMSIVDLYSAKLPYISAGYSLEVGFRVGNGSAGQTGQQIRIARVDGKMHDLKTADKVEKSNIREMTDRKMTDFIEFPVTLSSLLRF